MSPVVEVKSQATSGLFVLVVKAIMLPSPDVFSNLLQACYSFVVGVPHRLLCGSNKKKLRISL
jgi:hypothetical protein